MGCCDTPGLMPIDAALAKIVAGISPVIDAFDMPLDEAIGYVIAEDVRSPINVPPFANSAMDGYALRCEDLSLGRPLVVAGKSFAGVPFDGECASGQCVSIMTGAKIPQGCNAVIMQELADVSEQGVTFSVSEVADQDNIRPIGDDVFQNDVVLTQGARLTPRDIPLLASLGVATVKVLRRPKVAFFSTGDELRPLGSPLKEGQIYDSNRYGIKALVKNFGCEALDLGVIPDDYDTLKQTFMKAKNEADVVITSGGVSVGEADFIKDILDDIGQIGFWKLAIKPGKPFAYGTIDDAIFCGLPGNPVSAMLTMYVLVQPMLAKLSGHSQWKQPESIPAVATSMFKKAPGRTDYQRGIYQINDQGQFEVATTGNQGSGAFRSMSVANCFVVLEQDRGRVQAGETVNIQLFNSTLY